jgi:hypothetical protein
VPDLLLAEPPAEEDVPAAIHGGEVDEARVDVLHDRAEILDLLRARDDLARVPLHLLPRPRDRTGVDAAAVSRNRRRERGLLLLGVRQSAAGLDHPLHQRTHLSKRLVGLLGGEDARPHASMIPAIVGAGQRLLARRAPEVALPPDASPNPALGIFLWSRAAIWLAALFAWLAFEPNHHPRFHRWDRPWLHDSGWVVDVWGRWDSAWLVQVAVHGYDDAKRTAAFFPLYPGLVAGLGRILLGHYVLAGVLISLAACYGSFLLLQRLAEERLGLDGSRRAVLYLALFPMSLFLQAVYTESLFLLLTLLAFFLAERGRFAGAGLAAGLAILTRAVGVALLPALVLLAWRSRDRPRAFAGLAIAPLTFLVYPLVLWQQGRSPLAFLHAELDPTWARRFSWAGPFGGIWDGLRAAVAGVRQLVAGPGGHVYWPVRDTTPMRVAALNLELFAFLVLFLVLAVVVWRRFGSVYGLFCAISLAIPLSMPSHRWPLLSLPRFGLVIFPFFLALAVLGGRPRVHTAIVGVSALLLGVAVTQWALWQWVA